MIRKIFVGLVALLLSLGAGAVCPATDACIEWQPVVQYTDDTNIPADKIVTYKVYRSGTAIGSTTTVGIQLVKEPRGQQCYFMTAVVDNVESDPSNTVCKTIRSSAPTDGAIEAPSDGGIELP